MALPPQSGCFMMVPSPLLAQYTALASATTPIGADCPVAIGCALAALPSSVFIHTDPSPALVQKMLLPEMARNVGFACPVASCVKVVPPITTARTSPVVAPAPHAA